MVTAQEKQKEAYNLHLAAYPDPDLFFSWWVIQKLNIIKTTKKIHSSS